MNIDKWLNRTINNDTMPCYQEHYSKEIYNDTEEDDMSDQMNKNKYHADILFKQMIDYSYDNNFDYTVYNSEKKNYMDCNLMYGNMKDSFYKFCYENSVRYPNKYQPLKPIPINKST